MAALKAVRTGKTDSWSRPIAIGANSKRYLDINCGRAGRAEDWHAVTEGGEPEYPVKLDFSSH